MTIKPQRAGKVPPESAADRGIIVRPGVGAVGRIVQRAELTSHRVVVSAATLILIRSGRKKVRSSFGDCIGKPGDAIAIGAGETVDITNTPGLEGAYRAQWITWPDSAIESFSQANRSKDFLSGAVVLPRLSNDFLATYEAAFQSLLDIKGIPTTVANHRSHEVLLWLQSLGVQFRSKVYETLSMRVRRIMAGDPAREWTIDEVARQEHSSAASLRRHLVAEGEAFRHLLNEVRMSHALALLQNTDAPVLSVATSVGYVSPSRFADRFRCRFGYLPSELRGHRRGDHSLHSGNI